MVQKNYRCYFLVLLLTISLFISCSAEDTVNGRINNKDSVHNIWNYRIGYKTYNSDRELIREGIVDPYALKFFKVELNDEDYYISFFLKSFSGKSSVNEFHNTPVYLYMDNYLLRIDEIIDITVDIFITSPIEFKKIDTKFLEVIQKKYADYYLIYVTEVGSQSLAYSFIVESNPLKIDLNNISKEKIIDIEDFLKSDLKIGLLSMNEGFHEGKKYYINAIGFIENSMGETIQYTNQAINPFVF